MFWRGGQETPEEGVEQVRDEPTGPIRIERDAPRPATILRVAGELEERGGTILELFKEIESPLGRVGMPILLRQGGEDFFGEVANGPWNGRRKNEAPEPGRIVRGSKPAEAGPKNLNR